LLFDPRKLRHRILELSDCSPCSSRQIPNIVVRRFSRSFVLSQDCFCFFIQRRNDRLISFFVGTEQPLGLQGFQIQSIEEWPVTLFGSTGTRQQNRVAILQDQAAAKTSTETAASAAATTGVPLYHRCARIGVRILLPSIPKGARFSTR